MNFLSYLYLPCRYLRLIAFGVMVLLVSSMGLMGNDALALGSRVKLYSIPSEVTSSHFRVSVNGQTTNVMHATTSYYLLNFDTNGPVTISVTAEDPHFWDNGVEIQPMRFGIRPRRNGATITFQIQGPEKLTIARPGDHFDDADLLFLFANPIDYSGITSQTPGVRYYGPGVYHESIDAHAGDKIYLDGGAVIFGSLNIWQAENVRVLGRGTIIYDGPQNPYADEGWMHKPNWHVMVMDNAKNIEIDGITCITRSRSWQIQMRDSWHIGFYNIKAIGGNPNNANQDGMDWLGGGDTTVRNSFFRASDDVFAIQGNWDGYELEKMRIPGHDVTNITIEDTIASTSISNTIRIGWPQKTFNSAHFHMRNMDVINTGFGGCKVPFAFFELWADPAGRGSHSDYTFRDIRLEDWYSLFQIRQVLPKVRAISFADIWAMDGPAMVHPVLKGDVSGVSLRGVTQQGFQGAKTEQVDGAAAPTIEQATLDAHFTYTRGLLKTNQNVNFIADTSSSNGRHFQWIFGDGTQAEGREVHHRFADAEGTLLDGSGRFRVLLHLVDANGEQAWASEQVVLAQTNPTLAAKRDTVAGMAASDTLVADHIFHVPADGGYTFTLLTSTESMMSIDDLAPVHSPKARPQVCGSEGNSVQPMRISAALTAGDHHIRIERKPELENADRPAQGAADQPFILWEGPGIDRQPLP
jgi:hypothetical protein